MRWRTATEPPRLAQLLLALVTPPDERPVVLADLQDELEARIDTEGTANARRAYWRQALRSVPPGLRWRLDRALRRRGADASAPAAVDAAWRPAPRVAIDHHNRGENLVDFLNDLRLGLRALRHNKMVFAIAIASLAIGLGATTTVFSIANAFLLRPPTTELPDDLVAVFTSQDDGDRHGECSYPDYLEVVGTVAAFDGAYLYRLGGVELDDGNGKKRLLVELVGGPYFALTRLPLTLGRGFSEGETPIGGAQRLVVISHRLWRGRFAGDPQVLGRSIHLDGHPYEVVGVGPEGYLSPLLGVQVDAWVPMGVAGGIYHVSPDRLAERRDREYRVIGRLQPGRTLAQAQAQLSQLATALHQAHPAAWTDPRGAARAFTALGERDARLPGGARMAIASVFALLLAATGMVLLIACSNVACLFLARANHRRREMAVRLAIGAGRGRLVKMLLAESLVPALLAGVLGTALATWACRSLGTIDLPIAFPLAFDFQPDLRVLAFAVTASVLASIVFGLAPALEAASPDLVTSLKADAGTGDRRPGRIRLRRALVIGQVAAALVFAIGGGLALRGLQRAEVMDTGLDVARNAVMSRNLRADRFSEQAAASHLTELLERLRRRPEIAQAHVAVSAELTFMTEIHRAGVHPAEQPTDSAAPAADVPYNAVTAGYLEMMGIRLLRGRGFDRRDRPGAVDTAVVNEAFAARLWPGEDALGRRFQMTASGGDGDDGERWLEVVGVVRDGHYAGLYDHGAPFFWTALPQRWQRRVLLHVQGRGSAGDAVKALREEVVLEADEPAVIMPTVYRDLVDVQLIATRIASRLLAWGGLFGLTLAVLGIYGMVTFSVRQRSREMAIRQTFGARPDQVLWSLAGDGLRLAAWGLLIGLVLALPLATLLRSQLFGVSPLDPLAVGGSAALLLLAALAASLLPARRFAARDPMAVLREE